ncbi:phage protein GemA/Gp16 family protein [Paenibacillus sp. MSJ-34]|uniref:phage protein GemA/Gp16 family protein n=1 Tax=Paenibacillus sp. MSJ-34 TaxID=2841529 RepID=UPI001C1183F9|nr:phage protein GemA/Gp16 family protein [Paenibacillus sp. MSJ-34]MBU5442055.1 regulatory protein GemA [Paenibacillus sp. MSJ-34]
MATPISYPQIKKIFGLAKQVKMNNEELHDLVQSVTGSTSIKALSKEQGIKVIDRLHGLLGKGSSRERGRATPKQIWQINKLAEELGWKSDPLRLRRFLEKKLGVSHPSYLSPSQASKDIEAFKAMKHRSLEGGSADARRL